MAIIVDKVKKRKDIALSCKELFLSKGISELTISEVAKTAGIGKGTVYDYFSNKEDIVFEIVNILLEEHNSKKQKKLDNCTTTKEKIKTYFEFFYEDEFYTMRSMYKEFISVSLANPTKEMIAFNTKNCTMFYELFESILREGIEKNEIIERSIDLAKGLYVLGEGLFVQSQVTSREDVKLDIETYIDTIFDLIEVK